MAFSFPSKKANRSREAIHRLQILLQLERQCRVGARRVYESYPTHGIFDTVTTLTIALVRGSANTIRAITPSVYSCCRVVAPSASSWSSTSAAVHDACHAHEPCVPNDDRFLDLLSFGAEFGQHFEDVHF
jgi:hypothetical protein